MYYTDWFSCESSISNKLSWNKFWHKEEKYHVDFVVYKNDAKERFKDAVLASANLILHYHNLKVGKRENCGKQQWVVNKKLFNVYNAEYS